MMNCFSVKKSFTQAMVFDPDADQEFLDQFWSNPDETVDGAEKLVQKDCVRTTVKLESEIECFVVKRHLERSWRHFAKQCISRSRAEKCWNDTWFLYSNGYPTPRPVAFLEKRLGILRGNSFFVYQYVAGETLKAKATGCNNQRLIRNYISQLVDIWRLHAELRVNLSDGHPANFLVDPAGKMWVIDLDKLQRIQSADDLIPQLETTFERTLRGIFWDQKLLDFGMHRLREALSTSRQAAA